MKKSIGGDLLKIKIKKSGYQDRGVLVYFLFKEDKIPKEVSSLTKITDKEFDGELGRTYDISPLDRMMFKRILLVGLGERKGFHLDFLRRGAGSAIRFVKSIKCEGVSFLLPSPPETSAESVAQALVEGALLSNYKFVRLKTKKENDFNIERLTMISEERIENGVRRGQILGECQNWARELDELPANIATPEKIVEIAKKMAREDRKISVEFFDKRALIKKGMNGIIAVGKGSVHPPCLLIVEYNKGRRLPFYSLVGKGVTFDSGGISLKPSKNMHEMKYDKSGAIIVLAVVKAVSRLNLPIRILAALPLVENMPGPSAQKPGDIIRAYNGKTIEVLNTDAEGRLILADALAYVAEKGPEAIIDVATLTGAILVALGRNAIGLFSTDEKLVREFEDVGERTYERVWRFPLWKEYREMMKSDFADIKNISGKGEAGSITAAVFLKEFVGDRSWVHLDIAGVMDITENHPYLEKGASGIGVRLITEVLISLLKKQTPLPTSSLRSH